MAKPVDWLDFLSDSERVLNRYPSIIVPSSKQRQLYSDLFQLVSAKVVVVPDSPPPDPIYIGYIILPKVEYDRLFLPNGNPRPNLDSWQQKIAAQDWNGLRQSLDGTAAVMRVGFTSTELADFLQVASGIPGVDSSYQRDDPANGINGIDSLRDFLNNSPLWTSPDTGAVVGGRG